MKVHVLKCWPEPFAAIVAGGKRYEIRRDDRGYGIDDVLILLEFCPASYRGDERYTGAVQRVVVDHITKGGDFGLPKELCVLGIVLAGALP